LQNVIKLEKYMTKVTVCSPESTPPTRFLQFLDEIIQRRLGYCLTGSTREHALFFFYGTGANGKSVLISIISYVLGEYHGGAPMETFTATANERHPTELASLHGRRMVTSVETEHAAEADWR
jgi:putative DNA primase/helicase